MAEQVGQHSDGKTRAWEQVRGKLRAAAGQRLFDQWLKPIRLIDCGNDDVVRLGLPSTFMANWVRNHYAERLRYEFCALLPEVRVVSIETIREPAITRLAVEAPVRIAAPSESESVSQPKRPAPPAPAAIARTTPVTAAAKPVGERFAFDPQFRFDRFVTGQSNRIAFNAARAVAEPGVPRFTPLYLHSATGQGKTHLMHAIGNALLAEDPQATAIYMPAERFMFEFVQALRNRDTFAFKSRLRAVDMLMIDDLQFIAGKGSTQEECLHTVNEFMSAGKRLVIAADRPPHALDGVDSRLVSRLSSGLVADIQAPELDLRRAILAAKLAETPDIPVPQDVLDVLAGRITANVRELEGALKRLIAYSQLTGEAVTMDFAVRTLGDALRGPQRRITIDDIQKAVSTHFELRQLDLVSARRAVSVARPRQIAMYLAKRLTTRSLPEIGRKFGNRDHSTVIHAVRRIEDLRARDCEIDGAVRTLLRELEG
ncbi:chromosomal replication initiator protein DnaA [Stakelama sediminis]|uniref:Chromosomal replication initiator protein DnaA n=1 Tax=Stakelama sediminis TaxID=463200 RepID=A0A840YUM3_9SPHN|nr:chromosomal replication initiator protein DnaA [Stakelama sediminis]MBB5717333.1 chromosomal replication initiator protein [Stakelama sediminis]